MQKPPNFIEWGYGTQFIKLGGLIMAVQVAGAVVYLLLQKLDAFPSL